MKAAESMQALYEIIEKMNGPIEAKRFVSGSIYSIISELHEEKLTVTAEAIEKRLSLLAHDFITASKSNKELA